MMQSEDKLCVVVLFGGMSSEHEVSRVSAGTFVDNLDRARYEVLTVGITREGRWLCTEATSAQMADGSWEELPGNMPCVISPDRADHGMILFTPEGHVEKVHVDVVIPVLHGLWGEDGTVQGLLELAGIPYVGCGVLASAVCMDKAVANALFEANGVPHTKWVAANRWEIEKDLEGVCAGGEQKLGWPVFVKPANAGSSVGISKVSSRDELKKAIVADALPKNIAALKRDLGKYRIDYDVWFHESTLHESGAVLAVVDKLLELGACYKAEDGAIMYRSAQYAAKYGTVNKKKTEDGTEEEAKDEVLVRANGIPTYFAADIAYHYNKLATRGFAKAIDVWGADHHGHVARMKGAMDAIGLNGEDLDVVLMQMVNLMRDGQPVRMSKRTGNAITLTDLLEEVPIDSARFLFNMHDAGSGIDFDLDQAVKTDNDNPVYYVQYAHARICSILKKMESEGVAFAGAEQVDATLLTDPSEMDLIRMLAAFPQEIVMAAEKYDPSRINRFVIDLASAFHRFYGNCRIQGADPAVQQARLALCIGVKNVIFNVLTMFKINVPEKM